MNYSKYLAIDQYKQSLTTAMFNQRLDTNDLQNCERIRIW